MQQGLCTWNLQLLDQDKIVNEMGPVQIFENLVAD